MNKVGYNIEDKILYYFFTRISGNGEEVKLMAFDNNNSVIYATYDNYIVFHYYIGSIVKIKIPFSIVKLCMNDRDALSIDENNFINIYNYSYSYIYGRAYLERIFHFHNSIYRANTIHISKERKIAGSTGRRGNVYLNSDEDFCITNIPKYKKNYNILLEAICEKNKQYINKDVLGIIKSYI